MGISRRKFIKIGSVTTANITMLNLAANAGVDSGFWDAVLAGEGDLQKYFITPPDDTKSSCYWWWFNGLVSKEGISRDLEEFRKKGMGGVLLINSKSGLGGADMPQGANIFSKEWNDLFRHALVEAARLRIEVGVNLCSGWCMGGPWIKPEDSGRWYLQSELTVKGPQKFSGTLPLPGNRTGYDNVFNAPGYKEYIDLPLEQLDYRDTAVVAIPAKTNSTINGERKGVLAAKTNHKDASNFTRARDIMGPLTYAWKNMPEDDPIAVNQVIDLTSKLKTDGSLEWEVPDGEWVIVRTGHRMTGSKVTIAQPGADGLSVDWFASKPVDLQFDNFGKKVLEIAATVENNTLKYFHDDSFEDGFPNWTDEILEKFEHYRGYNAKPYLPALSGYIIGSAEVSDRFLNDYRKTLADCMADDHYKHFADLCHKHGLLVQNEAAGPSRSGTMSMDCLKNLGRSDNPMGEFWLGQRYKEEGGEAYNLGYGVSRLEDGQNKVTKMAASASHIYGRKTTSAEAFTQHGHWIDSPGTLKPALDRAFCEGINRIVVHCSTSTRPEDGLPGYEYGAGTHFNRNVTWWSKVGPFLSYVARTQYLLRQGLFVADILYYNGDCEPNIVGPKHIDPSLGKGYDYDVCNEEVLLTRLTVKNGRIILPDGVSYKVLVLPESISMPLPVLKKLEDLVKAGAIVAGPKPVKDSGLKNYPECDTDVNKLADELWGDCDGKTVTQHLYGNGKIYWGVTLRDILDKHGVKPDFEYSGNANTFIDFIHRATPDADVYFICNRNNHAEKVDCTFRMAGYVPQLWNPVTGETKKAKAYNVTGGRTTIPLSFEPHQSWFVIFNKANKTTVAQAKGSNSVKLLKVMELTGPWSVKFDTKWGGPESVQFSTLQDWSKHPDERIKYYSGKAFYKKTFTLPQSLKNKSLYLNLGEVKEIAQVKLNGKDLGIVWTNPWQVDISKAIKPGNNELEIEVINLWPNRLIGDAALPEDKRLTRTDIHFKKTDPLLPSGLLGPVTVQAG